MGGNRVRTATLMAALSGVFVLAGAVAGGVPGLVAAVAVALAMNIAAYLLSGRLALRAMHARPVSEVEYPRLYRVVREVSTAARQPMPRLQVSPAMQPNAFATGRGPRSAVVCCTEGVLRLLDERELRAVAGHELSHVYNRDVLVSSITAGLASVVTFLAAWLIPSRPRGEDTRPAGLLMLLLGPVAASIIQVAISRTREYQADAWSAALTGDPLALASALRKIEAGIVALPLPASGQLASAGHLMIANPFPAYGFARLFSTHPPTAERVRRLEAMAGYPR